VHLALARRNDGQEEGRVVRAEPTALQTFAASGWRFDLEENFVDDTSNGFPLESSLLRAATALERLGLVLALTTLSLVSPGTEVSTQGQRRWVDPHGFRGQSDLKIGGKWVERALSRGYELVTRWYLSAEIDPEPAMASRRQAQKPPRLCRALEFHDAVA
jgi:hypothetical protein